MERNFGSSKCGLFGGFKGNNIHGSLGGFNGTNFRERSIIHFNGFSRSFINM